MTGLLFIAIGILFLFKNLGLLAGGVWDILWPVLLVAVGVNMIIRKRHPGFFWEERFGWKERIGKEQSRQE